MQKVGAYVLDHPEDVALLSMREQARRAGVPPAAMTRFAQRLGYTGYDELRGLFAASIRGRVSDFGVRAGELAARSAGGSASRRSRCRIANALDRARRGACRAGAASRRSSRPQACLPGAAHLLPRPPLLLRAGLSLRLRRRALRCADAPSRCAGRHRRRRPERRRGRRRAARGVVRALHARHRRDRRRRARDAGVVVVARHRQPRFAACAERRPRDRRCRATLPRRPTSPRRPSRSPRCWPRWSSRSGGPEGRAVA